MWSQMRVQSPASGNDAETAEQVERVIRQFFAGEGDVFEDVAPCMAGPEPVGALEDRLSFLVDADLHNLVRHAAPEVVFLDRHVVVATDVHGGRASRLQEGESVIEVIQIDQALFDAGHDDD